MSEKSWPLVRELQPIYCAKHHQQWCCACPHTECGDNTTPPDHIQLLVRALCDGMQRWANDEDGVHPAAWDSFDRAMTWLYGEHHPEADGVYETAHRARESPPAMPEGGEFCRVGEHGLLMTGDAMDNVPSFLVTVGPDHQTQLATASRLNLAARAYAEAHHRKECEGCLIAGERDQLRRRTADLLAKNDLQADFIREHRDHRASAEKRVRELEARIAELEGFDRCSTPGCDREAVASCCGLPEHRCDAAPPDAMDQVIELLGDMASTLARIHAEAFFCRPEAKSWEA